MPIYKCSALINYASAVSTPNSPSHRTGGWSESVYLTAADLNTAIVVFQQGNAANPVPWCFTRAALLPIGSAIVGQRYQQISPLGPSQSNAQIFPAASGLEADTPQNALTIRIPGIGVNNISRRYLRALPDPCITEGEYTPPATFQFAMIAWLTSMNGYQFVGRDLSQPKQAVLSQVVGLFTLKQALVGINVGTNVRVLKTKEASGRLRGGVFNVVSVAGASPAFTVFGWPYGNTVGGNVRVDATVYPAYNIGQTTIGRIVVKKVGRPFGQYRGRRSARR